MITAIFPKLSRTLLKMLIVLSLAAIPKGPATGGHLPSPLYSEYDGMTLVAIPLQNGETFDVPVIESAEGLERIKQALAVLMDRSPSSARHVQNLKDSGRVIVVYDPHYPNTPTSVATLKVALFSPKYLPAAHANGSANPAQKEFLVVIGRHGIKWPATDLAAVLVHELVGHGGQHLTDNRLEMRQMDIECEAWLYQERAHQEFGLDKLSTEMIRFQQQLLFNCQEFINYLTRTDPDTRQQWRKLNPDVPVLLEKFKDYMAELQASGKIAKIKAFADAKREITHSQIFRDGPGSEINRIGDLYLYGMGTTQDYGLAAKWYRRAALLGCPDAQLGLATLYLDGLGIERSKVEAYFWLSLAAQNGTEDLLEKSTTLLKVALKDLTAGQIAAVNKRVSDVTANAETCD